MKTLSSLLFCLLLSLSACLSSNKEAGSGVPELDTTEAGLTAGAVIGAGVGALVGSTAGEAGTGVVLGGIAGATSGGLIGRAIETQERRIDQHDSKGGINTNQEVESTRGRLVDKIWSNPELNTEYNRPSGSKGVASRYVSPIGEEDIVPARNLNNNTEKLVQLRQDRTYIDKIDTSVKPARSNLPPAAKIEPRIELQKPKPELPSFSSVPTRKPSLDSSSTDQVSRYSNLSANTKNATKDLASNARAKLNETTDKAQTNLPKAEVITAPKNPVKKIETSQSAKVVQAIQKKTEAISSCEAGSEDYQRVKNASSDSDKVFYLRRVILSCPKDTSARIQLGKIYSKLGLKDEARKEFNAVLDVDPTNESVQDEMSIMMLDSRKN